MNDLAVQSGEESLDTFVSCAVFENVTWLDWANCSYNEDVAVFRFHWPDYTGNEPVWQSLLQPDEIQRAARYRQKEDQYRSLYARSLLRVLAGTYTNQNPLAVRLTTGVTSKPELQDNTWHINATHSGDWILVAIGKVSVGVDAEKMEPDFPFQDVVPSSFSVSEQHYIESGEHARLRFYELWTRKEALSKATAKGIDADFCQIPSLTGFHRVTDRLSGVTGAWSIAGFTIANEYVGAIAYKSIPEKPQFYTIDGSLYNR